MKLRAILTTLTLTAALAVAATADDLVANGSGLRTKPILGAMYELELRVPSALKGADAKTLIEADQPMAYVLTIKSGLINRTRYIQATTEGFQKAAESGYATEQQAAFLAQFDDTVFHKGDVILMHYGPAGLTSTYKTLIRSKGEPDTFEETVLATLPGLDLKQAVFAIWLGDSPVQISLQKALLGNR